MMRARALVVPMARGRGSVGYLIDKAEVEEAELLQALNERMKGALLESERRRVRI